MTRPERVRRAPCILCAAGLLLAGLSLPAPAGRAGDAVIVVREGDTLEAIALRHGTTIETLTRLNQLRDADRLEVGQRLKLPGSTARAAAPDAPAPDGPDGAEAQAALLLSPAERRDRAELAQREQGGQVRWKWFGDTAVDWNGWRLHPGGVRITLVRPALADVGLRRAGATALAVQCSSLRHTWRVDGSWEPWSAPGAGSVGLRIVLDLCSNTLDGPAVPIPPAPPG